MWRYTLPVYTNYTMVKYVISCVVGRNSGAYTADYIATQWADWRKTTEWNAWTLWCGSSNDSWHGNSNATVIWPQHRPTQTAAMASTAVEHTVWLSYCMLNARWIQRCFAIFSVVSYILPHSQNTSEVHETTKLKMSINENVLLD